MKPLLCPKCGNFPRVKSVDRVIGRLYRVDCCGMIAFGDPIVKPAKMREYEAALLSAYTRWNEAVKEVKG